MSNLNHDIPDALPADVTLSSPLGMPDDVRRGCRVLATDEKGNFTLPAAEMVGIVLVGVEGAGGRVFGGKIRLRNLTVPIRVHELSPDVTRLLELLDRASGMQERDAGLRAIGELILQSREVPPIMLVRPVHGEAAVGTVIIDFPEQGGYHAPPLMLVKTAGR